MPVSFAPVAPANPDTKELRLALVCYGGVSLAIYMHGLTKEVHKLVRASKSLEDGADGFGPGQVEHVYRDALAALERRDGGIRTRVVVDIVAGSSAGGINGICLAKALAHNLSQDSLRRLWLENGDINKLIARPFVAKRKGLKRKAAALVLTSLWDAIRRRPLQFPLSGDTMFGWVHDAMREMDESAADRGHPEGPSLLPEHHPIELLVTVTDFYGYEGAIDTYDPKRVRERRHRHVLRFRSGAGEELLDADHGPALAFAARATSAFPGAFPPIDLANIEHNLGTPDWTGRQSFDGDFWAIYGLSDADAWKTWFVDGGVLDNYPFRIAIDAITAKSAATEVDRRLLYLEPDPALPPPEPGKPWPQPGLLKTALGSLTTLPRQEPIRDDLLVVREFNDRVGRVIDLVRAKEADVEKLALPKGKEAADVYAGVAKELGLAYEAYVRLKLVAVVERFAEVASELCGFTPDSDQARFVHDVLLAWAREPGKQLLADADPNAQREFLKVFDLGYGERRLRFVIKALSELYPRAGEDGYPTRGELNKGKERLYALVYQLSDAVAGAAAGQVGESVRAIFQRARVASYLDRQGSPDEAVADFVRQFGAQVDGATEQLRSYLNEQLTDFGKTVSDAVHALVEGWQAEPRTKVLARYVGFPYWDVMVFPIQKLSDVGELNRVEVVRMSPLDEGALKPEGDGGKLKGVAFNHFGAFFDRSARENDYLWGRLDGAERLLRLLFGGSPDADAFVKRASQAILAEEQTGPEALGTIGPVFQALQEQVDTMEARR